MYDVDFHADLSLIDPSSLGWFFPKFFVSTSSFPALRPFLFLSLLVVLVCFRSLHCGFGAVFGSLCVTTAAFGPFLGRVQFLLGHPPPGVVGRLTPCGFSAHYDFGSAGATVAPCCARSSLQVLGQLSPPGPSLGPNCPVRDSVLYASSQRTRSFASSPPRSTAPLNPRVTAHRLRQARFIDWLACQASLVEPSGGPA